MGLPGVTSCPDPWPLLTHRIAVAPTVLAIESIFYGKSNPLKIKLSVALVCLGVGAATVTEARRPGGQQGGSKSSSRHPRCLSPLAPNPARLFAPSHSPFPSSATSLPLALAA